MGLFDEIRCEARLPDGYKGAETWFQSKSFPYPSLERYTISSEGRLLDAAGNDLEADGYVSFYTIDRGDENPVAPDRDELFREYRARFAEGQLREIVRVTSDQENTMFYGLASFRWFRRSTEKP